MKMKARRSCLPTQFLIGLLLGVLIMPPSTAQAQWTVYDPAQYALQIKKKLEEAQRHIQTFDNLVKQLTTLKGVLDKTEELVANQRNMVTTMSNIGRTSQDSVATMERLMRMDNTLEQMQRDLERARARKAWAERRKATALENLKKEETNKCAECVARINQELAECEQVIGQAESQIARLRDEIAERYKKYNIEMEERVRFGEQVQSMNKAWSRFNDSLDELQRTLR